MKIAVFSDIHGNYEALKSIISDIKSNNYDEVICLGDLIGLGPSPKECLKLLMENNITLLLGNHELYSVKGTNINDMSELEKLHHEWVDSVLNKDDINYLRSCKLLIERKYGKYKLLFEHFLLNDKEYPYVSLNVVRNGEIKDCFYDLKYDYIFIGHEHNSFEIKNSNNTTLMCVGSSGCRKDDDTFYTVIEIDEDIKIYKKYLKYDRVAFESVFKSINYPDKENVNKIFFGVE